MRAKSCPGDFARYFFQKNKSSNYFAKAGSTTRRTITLCEIICNGDKVARTERQLRVCAAAKVFSWSSQRQQMKAEHRKLGRQIRMKQEIKSKTAVQFQQLLNTNRKVQRLKLTRRFLRNLLFLVTKMILLTNLSLIEIGYAACLDFEQICSKSKGQERLRKMIRVFWHKQEFLQRHDLNKKFINYWMVDQRYFAKFMPPVFKNGW